ncbi:MAG: hypothetical protein AAB019_08055 [Planctomycetota bacterium]
MGPEGDFTKEEVAQAKQNGFQPVLLPVGFNPAGGNRGRGNAGDAVV